MLPQQMRVSLSGSQHGPPTADKLMRSTGPRSRHSVAAIGGPGVGLAHRDLPWQSADAQADLFSPEATRGRQLGSNDWRCDRWLKNVTRSTDCCCRLASDN